MVYKFDNYTLDPEEGKLRRCGAVLELTPKVFQTLLVLIQNHDHVMSKEELLHTIWPDQFVEESNIIQNISVLRKALEEATQGKKYIATFPGRGYRFLEPVVIAQESSDSSIAETTFPSGSIAHGATQGKESTRPGSDASQPSPPAAWTGNWRTVAALLGLGFLVLSIGIVWNRKSRAHEHPAGAEAANPIGEIRTLARMEGAQYEPSWSRDGKRLAFVYVDSNGSRSAIYIQFQGELQPRRVVYGPGEFSSPVFSPDGNSLAYVHIQRNSAEIVILDLRKLTSRKLATLFPHRYGLNCRHLDWSPTGDYLAVDDKSSETDPLSLYLVYVSDGNKIRLTYPTMDIIGDVAPRFSPDGTQVAFIRIQYQYVDDVLVLPVTGGEARKLTDHSGFLEDADWETNNSLIFSGDYDGEFKLWRLDLRSPHPHRALASSIATDMPLQLSISRQAGQIAFSAYRPDLNIWALDLSRRASSAAEWTPVIRTPGQDIEPSYSPDGKRISFRSDVSGQMQIWVSRADGSDASPIHTGALVPVAACWAPDGKSIVFSAQSTPGVYEVSVSRGLPVRLISRAGTHPYYARDGKWIFLRRRNFIYRIPAQGGAAEELTAQGGAPIMQSQDGRYLYFGQDRMDQTISRLDLSTRRQEVVVKSIIPGYRDSWTLASKGIFFLTERSGRPTIAFYDFAAGRERDIAEFPGPLPPLGTSRFSVSPDDRRLLVVRADPTFASIQTAAFGQIVKP